MIFIDEPFLEHQEGLFVSIATMMTFEEYKRQAVMSNPVPVSMTLLADQLTPVSAYLKLRTGTTGSFLFESVEGGERFARYSFIGRDPKLILRTENGNTSIRENGAAGRPVTNLFDAIREISSRYNRPSQASLPRFTGGLVGFIGYDAVKFIERIPSTGTETTGVPDSLLGLFGSIVIFDHFRHEVTLLVNIFRDSGTDPRTAYDRACRDLENLRDILDNGHAQAGPFTAIPDENGQLMRPDITRDDYTGMVKRAKEHIAAGDIFQVVLSQRFHARVEGDVFNVYRALRVVNPSPYLYFIDLDGCRVIGSSPEILVRGNRETAEVFPIAGTRPRGVNEADDLRLEQELRADEKERAEHMMLVDLGRNDLGRVCIPGSVVADPLMTTVRYSHVMHLASRVSGRLKPGTDAVDLFIAAFPAGTVSGAPKIRAMEIIDSLEPARRCLYAGGVGYIDFSGSIDFCIAIRTIVGVGDRLYCQAGAGIVADSVPVNEYDETISKARALAEAVRRAGEIAS